MSFVQQSGSGDSSADASSLQARLQETESQLKAVVDERTTLLDRLRKANEENLKLANNIRVRDGPHHHYYQHHLVIVTVVVSAATTITTVISCHSLSTI